MHPTGATAFLIFIRFELNILVNAFYYIICSGIFARYGDFEEQPSSGIIIGLTAILFLQVYILWNQPERETHIPFKVRNENFYLSQLQFLKLISNMKISLMFYLISFRFHWFLSSLA